MVYLNKIDLFRGQFEYELVLRPDLYTRRHTQWYYFRVQNMIANITYRFRIINLMKKGSLYNEGNGEKSFWVFCNILLKWKFDFKMKIYIC